MKLILYILLLLLLCPPLQASPKKKKKAAKQQTEASVQRLSAEEQRRYDYFFLEAIRLKEKKEYAAAFDLLQHCLEIDLQAASALYELSQYYMYLKQPQKAVTLIEKAVENEPQNYWFAQGLANLYMQLDETEKATALLEDMTVKFPEKTDPLYSLLDIYHRAEDYDKVIAMLNQLESRVGKNEQLTMEKFRIYLQKKDDKRAFREIESLVEEYPKDLRYQVILGDVYMQHDRQEEAHELYEKVLQEEPDNAMAMYSLATYYEETGQQGLYEQQLDALLLNKKVEPDTKLSVMRQIIIQDGQAGRDSTRVVTLFDRIMEGEPDDDRLPMLYAQYLLSKQMNEKAWPVLQKALDIDPTNAAARMTLLGEAVRKEDYGEITNLCEAGVESNPDMLEFYFYLAVAYNHDERTDEVISTCLKALEQTTSESKKEVVSDFYAILGDAYHAKERDAEAYEAYESALQYNSENISALNNYAYYLSLEERELDKAEEMSYKTVKAEPDNATYLDTYAWILYVKGNYIEARLYIDQAIKNDKEGSNVVLEHCGDIYYKSGDADGAMKYWQEAWDKGNRNESLKQKIENKKM